MQTLAGGMAGTGHKQKFNPPPTLRPVRLTAPVVSAYD